MLNGDFPIPNRLTDFPKVLRQRRKKLGLSQAELARKAGVARSHIACIEKGHRKPSTDVLWKLLKVCASANGKKSNGEHQKK